MGFISEVKRFPRLIIQGFILLALCGGLTSCSYLFPKQFEKFVGPEELDQLEDSQANSSGTSNTSESQTKDKTSQSKSTPSADHHKKPQDKSAQNTPSSSESLQGVVITKPSAEKDQEIEIALLESQSKIELNTPQPIRLVYSKNRMRKAPGDLQFFPCGNIICTGSLWSKTKLDSSIRIQPKYDFLEFKGKPYRGEFLIKNIGGKLTFINKLPIEDYLRGVLPHEIGILGDWAYEALKAQAISARTYTYKNLNRRRSRGFDLYADVRDQMYLGASEEYALSNNAIAETRDIVMTHQGQFVEAFYHSTCGGETADVSKVWNSQPIPYLVSRQDRAPNGQAWCSTSSLYEWEYRLSDSYFTQQLSKNAKKATREISSKISNPQLTVLKRSQDGRVEKARIRYSGKEVIIPGDKIRWLIKPPKSRLSILPSSLVKLDYEGGKWHIHGKGFGHGIGLCQMGARERSRAGQDYQTILLAYYTGISLTNIHE